MTLLEQCGLWHENDEYQKIIDSIEGLPEEERTPELLSELGRAYSNLANTISSQEEAEELFKKALRISEPLEEHFSDDHYWNYRMGYAYYYLGKEGRALKYFQKALEARPGDEDTQELIDSCCDFLSLPRFEKNFRQRTAEAWEAFEEIEEELRGALRGKAEEGVKKKLLARFSAILESALSDPAYEIGFDGRKYELVLSAEGIQEELYPLVYFTKHAPQSVREHWDIYVGRQGGRYFDLVIGTRRYSPDEVQVLVEEGQGGKVSLTVYYDRQNDDSNEATRAMLLLTDQILGEVAFMAAVDGFSVSAEPLEKATCLLSELPEVLTGMGIRLENDAEAFLENSYVTYDFDALEDKDAEWRMDTRAGSTRLPAILSEYFQNETRLTDEYYEEGITAGFLIYPLQTLESVYTTDRMFKFRDGLEAALLRDATEEAVTLLGGATGLYFGYVDFLAWDLQPVLSAAKKYFEESGIPWGNFCVFRRDVGGYRLIAEEGKDLYAKSGGSTLPS